MGMLGRLRTTQPCHWSADAREDDACDDPDFALRLVCGRIAWNWNDAVETRDYRFPAPVMMGFTDEEGDLPRLRRFDLRGLMPALVAYVEPPAGVPGEKERIHRFVEAGLIFDHGEDGIRVSAIATRAFHLDTAESGSVSLAAGRMPQRRA